MTYLLDDFVSLLTMEYWTWQLRTDHFIVEFQDVGIIKQIAVDLESTGSWGEGWTVDEVGLKKLSTYR